MPRVYSSLLVLIGLMVGGAPPSQASHRALPASPKDTIVVRLPNKATLMLTVRNVAQLRQMKNYHLDSLTSQLANYITQAEKAAQTATTDQVTVQFYPDKDQPGKNMPEQIRITTRKRAPNTNKVEVMLNKTFGVVVTTDEDGSKNFSTDEGLSKQQRQAKRDSSRMKSAYTDKHSSFLVLDVGLNAFVNQKPYRGPDGQPENVELRPEGSRYINIGLNYDFKLGGRRSPVSIVVGPEFSFNNYMLNGNDQWVSKNGRTDVVRNTDGRQFEKSKLATSAVNLPLMLQLKLRDAHYKPTLILGAGGFVGYRTGAHTKVKYNNEGTTYKDKDYGSYNLENFQYGLQGTLGYRSLQFFAKYNLNPLFKANQGPDVQTLSFGLRIFGTKN